MTVRATETPTTPATARTTPPPHQVLLNPGPVNVHDRVRAALAYPDVCHREPEAAELLDAVRAKATAVCGGDERHTSVLLAGSGTAALEAVLSSVVPQGGALLVPHNGHYAERVASIAEAHRIPVRRIEFGWGEPIDLAAVDAALAEDATISHVGLVHHETSTGMLNPLSELGEIVARHGRSLIVDAISTLGAEPLDVVADHVDWCVGTANKCLEGLPGTSFVCAPRALLDGLSEVRPRTYYLDLGAHHVAQDRARAPLFTPAVQALYALDVALDLTLEETVAARSRRYREHADRVRAHLAGHGFEPLVPDGHRASSVTVFRLPDGVEYQHLHDRLKADGFVIYGCPPRLGSICRIATMGQLTTDQISAFLVAFDAALGAPLPTDDATPSTSQA
ncbi:pyridoxal-phosphate-dependent aminotransferase family protein [Actinoalloteichus spitiensis]|uniref:pyridoxal-phosphate-dependent aminotransferase family protein n=1 Tax=Actinoalloteichus spitiensis TaxID=252394 RepID=UPI0012F6B915|nr:aminotransferase class V-fold PLP-dependent enzyme [Actinoalloteichus spitiensis]